MGLLNDYFLNRMLVVLWIGYIFASAYNLGYFPTFDGCGLEDTERTKDRSIKCPEDFHLLCSALSFVGGKDFFLCIFCDKY